jgi:hypothetical protein
MKLGKKKIQVPAPKQDDDLLRLELRVAKRADKLWQRAGYCAGKDLIHWQKAEGEVLERYFRLERPIAAGLATEQ